MAKYCNRGLRQAIFGVAVAMVMSVAQMPSMAMPPDGDVPTALAVTAPEVLDAASLVQQLGNPIYAVRERTERQLRNLGMAAESALVDALDHPDAEVRYRGRRILVAVRDADLQLRIAAFARDLAGNNNHNLPGWTLFRKAIGNDRASRTIYLKALRSEPALLEAIELGPDQAAEAVQRRSNELYAMVYGQVQQIKVVWPGNMAPKPQPVDPKRYQGNVMALLLAIADPDRRLAPDTTTKLFNLVGRTGLNNELSDRQENVPFRRLFAPLILRSANTSIAHSAIRWSTNFNLKEGLVPAAAMIRSGAQHVSYLSNAILAVGKLGDKAHIGLLAPLLKDDTPLHGNRTPKKNTAPQVRDIALAISIHLSGQDLLDYGFKDAAKGNAATLHTTQNLTFDSDAQRQAAMERWNEWLERDGAAADAPTKASPAKTGGAK